MIWVSLALEMPSFRASSAWVLTLLRFNLASFSSIWYVSARFIRSMILASPCHILLNNETLWGMVILGPGVRVAIVSASQHLNSKKYYGPYLQTIYIRPPNDIHKNQCLLRIDSRFTHFSQSLGYIYLMYMLVPTFQPFLKCIYQRGNADNYMPNSLCKALRVQKRLTQPYRYARRIKFSVEPDLKL